MKIINKILEIDLLRSKVSELRQQNIRITLANGCFDVIHVGHIRYLEGAKATGDLLFVGINSDSSVKQLKGNNRPVMPDYERAEIIAALSCVDFVIIFDSLTVQPLLEILKPDTHAKGTDYTVETVPEYEFVRSYGGKVAIVGDQKDHSTTDFLNIWRS